MKIYTKTGDKGETGIIGGRIPKDSPVIDAIGNLDELNAFIGLALAHIENHRFKLADLNKIQNILFEIGAVIAGGKSNLNLEEATQELEIKIDETEKKLPKLTRFILPGGSLLSSYLHMARSICRRVERSLVKLVTEKEKYKVQSTNVLDQRLATSDQNLGLIIKFINRLSDYLFVLARLANLEQGKKEVYWEKQ